MTTSSSPSPLRDLYATMLLIREVESTLSQAFAAGEIPGFIHLSVGQEAVAAGIVAALRSGDTLATSHRGHGHVLARGLALDGFFKEIYGRAGGVCKGRGGSMHVSDMSLGIIGANGIVGAGIPIALGSALALKSTGNGNVAVAIFGDGAMTEGVFYESLNFAALQKLPLLFVCENNGWSEFSPTSQQFTGKLDLLSSTFGISYAAVNGNDVATVAESASSAVARLRTGDGPFVLECHTQRMRGHFEGDPQTYRDKNEIAATAKTDPLVIAEAALDLEGFSTEQRAVLQADIRQAVQDALASARQDNWPTLADAACDVYTESGV